jgi:outer membrane protein assembly factor BamD (BamD/ComL family)
MSIAEIRRLAAGLAALFFLSLASFAVTAEHALMVREATIYIDPDGGSGRIGTVARGREVAILEKRGDWVHIIQVDGELTGWIRDKGVVRPSTPNGDKIVFGEAEDSESEASQRHGRKGADQDALRLYYRMAEYFPQSSLAGEALYRAADIRWQIEMADMRGRPSAKERSRELRAEIDDEWLRQVIKKFPGTKWADLAAYHIIEAKMCPDWGGDPKCAEKDSEAYEKYVREHPQSPKAAEALYQAAYRQATLIDLYRDMGNEGRSNGAKGKAMALAQQVASQYAQTDWAPRAQRLLYLVQQGIAVYGNTAD